MGEKILILGLGNPEDKFGTTRHNSGKQLLNFLRQKWAFPDWQNKTKLQVALTNGQLGQLEIILAKSENFMNNSGQSAKLILKYNNVDLVNFWLVHDDSDLELGSYKFSYASGSGGHHGAQSVIDALDSNEFNRVRIGIRSSQDQRKAEEFVLTDLTPAEREQLKTALEKAVMELEQKLAPQY